MRWRRTIKILTALTTGSMISLGLFRVCMQQQQLADDRSKLAKGVNLTELWTLGGLPQWVRIRGRDATKPLLLWIHGGPGFPQTPFAVADCELEKDFIVIQWDQRGAGRTYRENRRPPNMRVEQFVDDAHELLVTALRRFERRKCVLVAHSWGSIIGALVASRYPELVSIYIGVGQIASYQASERYRFDQAMAAAVRGGHEKALSTLRGVGPPPHRDMDDCKVIDRWFNQLVPRQGTPVSPWVFIKLAFGSPDYSWLDLVAIPRGVALSIDSLWKQIYYETDLTRSALRIDVPVHFITGEDDRIAPLLVAQDYLNRLEASRGRELHRFARSSHWPFLEEREKFCALIRKLGAEPADSSGQSR